MLRMQANQSIGKLVEADFTFARQLDAYGIAFYNCESLPLSEVCRQKKIKLESLLSDYGSTSPFEIPAFSRLNGQSAVAIIQYLKHHHYLFIKDQLPFIQKLISHLTPKCLADNELVADLKFVFPLFQEDFIHHIYEEEDTLFAYILQLNKVLQSGGYNGDLYYAMEQFSIQELALEHGEDDDEMKGIRGIIDQHSVDELEDLHLKVIFKELQSFDAQLEQHARIENEILFPKALNMEKKVQSLLSTKIGSN
ncbi:MAG: iron-sulfur cluster repair di-iron protein [Cyclobacteriaceae bacterium]